MSNRLTLILKAKFSRFLDRVEDPAELLDYSYEQQVQQLYGLRRNIVELVTAKKRIEHQRERRQEQFRKLDAGARKALTLGREDLAREALERKHQVAQELIGLDQSIAELERQQAQLIVNTREYGARVERFRSRKEITKAQYAAAKAQLEIAEAASGASSQLQGMGEQIRRAQERTEEMTLRASVNDELEGSGVLAGIGEGEDDIDRQLRQLAAGGSVDDELARMRQQVLGR